MKNKAIMTILACLLCGGMANAQGDYTYTPTVPDRILPTPASRVFQKFTEYPVSHATGTIDIQIPLYTLETGGLSIPLALKYHSSGVRVQDPVGAFGRNWALFPGFKISRTIMSKPDEIYPVTDIGGNPTLTDQLCIASPYSDAGEACDCWNSVSGHGVLPRIDGQYDMFHVNMAGISCSFILQREGNADVVRQIVESPLKITPLLDNGTNYYENRLYGFEVLDDKGNRYLFGESTPVHSYGSGLGYIEKHDASNYFCGWMLREVVAADGSRTTFTYQQVTEDVPLYNKCVNVLDNGSIKGVPGCYTDGMVDNFTGSDSPFWRFLGSEGYRIKAGDEPPYDYADKSLMPHSITFPNGKVDFTYSSGKLTRMNVKRTDGSSVKDVSFTYDTATGNLLKKVALSGEGDFELGYKNEGTISRRGFDWWGYYNGQTEVGTNLPTLSVPVLATTGSSKYNETVSIGYGADRSPNSSYMATHSLTSVTSPTGGVLTVAYEPHSYTVQGSVKSGGGLRVKSTSLYDPVSGKTTTRSYSYGDAHYLGNGYPEAKSLLTNRYLCPLDVGYCTIRMRTYSIFSRNPYMNGTLSNVWYGKVTETSDGWKKEYAYDMKTDVYGNYYNDQTSGSVNNTECLPSQFRSMLYGIPMLLKEDSYRKEGNEYVKVRSLAHTYDAYSYTVKGTIGFPYLKIIGGYSNCQFLEPLTACQSNNYADAYGSPIRLYPYYINAGIVRPATTRRVDYHGTDSIVETTTLAYDETRRYNVTSRTVQKSDGTEETERYYYSNHTAPDKASLTSAQQTAIGTLTTNNRLTTVVQQEKLRGSTKLYSVLNGFDSGSLLKQQYYRKGSGSITSRMEYKVYDAYRNPIHAVKDGTEHAVYIWGYKGERPVAEIRGATYDAVKSALGCTPESLSSATSPNMTLIDGLRSKLAGATVTTYTHDPLVGPLTRRDANTNQTTYQYDSYGRLDQVKDNSGRQKEKYQYNFRP